MAILDHAGLDAMAAGDLRGLLRRTHADCKGSFAANAPKEVCINILLGVYKRSDYATTVDAAGGVNMYNLKPGVTAQPAVPFDDAALATAAAPAAAPTNGSAQTATAPTPVAGPAEGVHAEKDATVAAIDAASQQLTEKVMALVSIADPANAAKVRELLERGMRPDVALKTAQSDAVQIVGNGTKVKIAGIEFDIVGGKTHVPKVDPNYRFDAWNAECRVGAQKFKHDAGDMLTLLVAGERLWLGGPPGVGKTSVIAQFCARTQWPFTRVQGDKDFMKEDFLGEKTATNGNIEYIYGLLAVAMKEGHIFVCDEITYFPAAVKTVLNPVLEPGGKLVLPGNGGEIIEPHPNFRIIATDNRFGHGDDTGLFPNSQVQDAALLSRWDHTLCVTWMTSAQERDLLVKTTGIAKEMAELIAKTATDTRDAADNGKLLYPLTLRHTLSWAKGAMLLSARAGEHSTALAFASACINKVPESDKIVIAEIAQRHFGDKLGKIAKATKAATP